MAEVDQEKDMKLDPYLIEPDENGIVWLEMKGKAVKSIKYGMWGSIALFPLLIVFVFFGGPNKEVLYPIVGGMMLLSGIMAYFSRAMLNNIRLGRDDERIYIANWSGQTAYAPFKEVSFTGNRIIIGNVAVILMDGKRNEFYDQQEYKTYIEPLTRLMVRVTEMEFMLNNLKNGDVKTWLGIIIGVSTLIAVFYFEVM